MKNMIFPITCYIILASAHATYATIAQDVQGSDLGENVGDVQLGASGKIEKEIESYCQPEIGLESTNLRNTSLSGTNNQSSHKKRVYKQSDPTQDHRGNASYERTYGDNVYVYSNQNQTGTISRTFNQGFARNTSVIYNQGYASNTSGIHNQGTYQRSLQNHESLGPPRNNQVGYGYFEHHHSGNISVTFNNQGNFANPFIKEGDALRNGSHKFHGRSRFAQGGYEFNNQGYSGNIPRTINQGTFRNVILNQSAFVVGHGSHVYDGHSRNAHRGYVYSNQDHSGNIFGRLNNQGNFKNLFGNQGGLIIGHGVYVDNEHIE